MTVLAHSELLKRIAHIDEGNLREPFRLLGEATTTSKRFQALRVLAREAPCTISHVLHIAGLPRGGGSYLNIKAYFIELDGKGILQSTSRGTHTDWDFASEFSSFAKYFRG